MAGSSTNIAAFPPRKPLLPAFAASDIFAGALVQFVEPTSSSTSPGMAVKMVTASTERPDGVAYADAAAGHPVTVYDAGEGPQVWAGGSVQPGNYVGVSGTSEAAHPITGVKNKYPVLGVVSGASGTAVWAAGLAMLAANPNQKFTVLLKPTQLSTTNKYFGVAG